MSAGSPPSGRAPLISQVAGLVLMPVLMHRASAPPSSRYKTAMRTLTPLATCSTIVDRAESATSAAISTPRFIGPGCITMACSGSCVTRVASSP